MRQAARSNQLMNETRLISRHASSLTRARSPMLRSTAAARDAPAPTATQPVPPAHANGGARAATVTATAARPQGAPRPAERVPLVPHARTDPDAAKGDHEADGSRQAGYPNTPHPALATAARACEADRARELA